MMTPGFAKSRQELFWLPYPEPDRVIINSHNFEAPGLGFGNEYWMFRGPTGVTDQSENGRNATYFASMGTVADTGSGGTVAFSTNGSSHYMQLPTLVAATVSAGGSCGLWIKPAALSGLQLAVVNRDPNRIYIGTDGTSAYIRIGNGSNMAAGNAISTSAWWLLVATWTGSNAIAYLNGTQVGTGSSIAFGSDVGGHTTSLGGYVNTLGSSLTSNGFSGRSDDVRFSSAIWTPTQIAAWYAGGRGYDA